MLGRFSKFSDRIFLVHIEASRPALYVLLFIVAVWSAGVFFVIAQSFNAAAQSVAGSGLRVTNSPRPDISAADTADWQVYTNGKYGFEARYPADWRVREESLGYEDVVVFYSVNVVSAFEQDQRTEMKITILPNSGFGAIDAWLKGEGIAYSDMGSGLAADYSVGHYKNPYEVVFAQKGAGVLGEETVSYALSKNFVVAVNSGYSGGEHQSTYQAFLSTFRFTKTQ